MKKFISVLLMFVMVLSASRPMQASAENAVLLSEMSVEECVAFLKENGIQIPGEVEDEWAWGSFAKDIIAQVELNPNKNFVVEHSVVAEFVNDIKEVVAAYYNMDTNVSQAQTRSTIILRDNTVCGDWDDSYMSYNCYGYAIGYHVFKNPGYHAGKSLALLATIDEVVDLVEEDLETLGCSIMTISTTIPTVTVFEHTRLICVRQDEDIRFNGISLYLDYHFMKLSEDGYWYHKPGQTIPLRYHYTPSNDKEWISEGKSETGEFQDLDVTYEGTIYFIAYTTPHEYIYEERGIGQHILTCTICGETSGSVADCAYVNDYCSLCGQHDHSFVSTGLTGRNYHEGSLHYYEYESVCEDCGAIYYYWQSQRCYGPPCNVIMGIGDHEEIIK